MTYSGMQYGDISPRVGLYAVANFLVHAQPQLILERFAMTQAVPKNSSSIIKWRRPIPFAVSTEQLVEGITPAPMGIEYEDVTGVLAQYGAWIGFTDVLQDTHEDDNLKTMTMLKPL